MTGDAVASLLAVREALAEQIKELDHLLADMARASTACQILMSIPGVGVQTAVAFAACIDDADRFRRSPRKIHPNAVQDSGAPHRRLCSKQK